MVNLFAAWRTTARCQRDVLESVILANGSETLPSLLSDIDAITAGAARSGAWRLIVIFAGTGQWNWRLNARNAGR